MNYKKIYKELCGRGKNRAKESNVIYEVHHIMPRSFGGKDTKENLTTLTLKEHYIAHRLLVTIYPNSSKMKKALFCMCFLDEARRMKYKRYKPSGKTYEQIRGDYIKSSSGVNSPYYGIPLLEETKRKISEAHKGKPAPWNSRPMKESTKKKLSEFRTGRKSFIKYSDEYKKQISERRKEEIKNGGHIPSSKGLKHSDKTISILRNTLCCKKIVQLSISGEFIKEYQSSKEVEREIDIFATSVRKCCRGGVKTAGGFNWVFAEEYYKNTVPLI